MRTSLLCAALVLALSTAAQAANVSYSFGQGATLQGWTVTDLGDPAVGPELQLRSLYINETTTQYYLGTDGNGATDTTKIAKSPEFQLDGPNATITATMIGGNGLHGTEMLPGGTYGPDEITTFPVSPLATNVHLDGAFMGLALWDVTTGAYVAATTNGTTSADRSLAFADRTISAVGLNTSDVYSLHFIDEFGGIRPSSGTPQSWGWCGLGSVTVSSVPEPSTIALLATGLIGLLAYAWRKRK